MSNQVTATNPEIEAAVGMYADLTLEADRLEQEWKTLEASFKEKHKDLIASKDAAKESATKQLVYLRSISVEWWKSLPEADRAKTKKLTLGVEIEERTRVDYNPKRMAAILKVHFPGYLVPDKDALTALGEAMMMKPDLMASVHAVLSPRIFKVYKEPIASVSGLKVMSEVVQVNAAKSVMTTFETATVPTTPVKPIAKRRAPDPVDNAVEAAAAAFEALTN